METDYRFGRTEGGDESGFNDPNVTAFDRGEDLSYYLVREAIQNSIDAVDDETKPVEVILDAEHLSRTQFPNADKLAAIFNACIEYNDDDNECRMFFGEALKTLNKPTIPFLRISDYNTVGLNPVRQKAFLGSVGRSVKNAGSGGSFGLGKGSLFASSQLRTIFVNSAYATSNSDTGHFFKGKLRLVSHSWEGFVRQGNGSYGLANQDPIEDVNSIPHQFNCRDDRHGTDIWIAGFDQALGDNWSTVLINSVLDNYWLSIAKNKLIVSIGTCIIDKDSLSKTMSDYQGTKTGKKS
ncbi:MAG: hypothetical protein EHM43_07610, partial [Ignavibacteriae bacterium]